MSDNLQDAHQNFIQGMSGISNFWGFPKAMGAIYGSLYLSLEPLTMDEIVSQVNVTKGAVSTNLRTLERLGMVHKKIQIGERKNYYIAETDFWKIIKAVLKEREKSEFDHALQTVGDSLEMVEKADFGADEAELADFYSLRLQAMERFFNQLDNLVVTVLAIDDLRIDALERILGVQQRT